jgi:hypothetical protein
MGDLTGDEMARLRVRVPDGLDPTGLTVGHHTKGGPPRGMLNRVAVLLHACRVWSVWRDLDAMSPSDWALDETWVDLTDARTRDALARWAAGRVTAPEPLTTAPGWRALVSGNGWAMSRPRVLFLAAAVPTADRPQFVVPALAGLHHHDDHLLPNGSRWADHHLLPDGSRWVDAAALAEVVRHLGGSHAE